MAIREVNELDMNQLERRAHLVGSVKQRASNQADKNDITSGQRWIFGLLIVVIFQLFVVIGILFEMNSKVEKPATPMDKAIESMFRR